MIFFHQSVSCQYAKKAAVKGKGKAKQMVSENNPSCSMRKFILNLKEFTYTFFRQLQQTKGDKFKSSGRRTTKTWWPDTCICIVL